jgi:hypothetical protein
MPGRYFILLRESREGHTADPKDYKARGNFEIHELRSLERVGIENVRKNIGV